MNKPNSGMSQKFLYFVIGVFCAAAAFTYQNCTITALTPKFPEGEGTNANNNGGGGGGVQAKSTKVVTTGNFYTTATGRAAGLFILGRAVMVRDSDGSTTVTTQVNGLSPNTAYNAHVHNLPCGLGGGGHYLKDTSITTVIEANEMWPSFTTDADGAGFGVAEAPEHYARPDATSIVLHGAGGERIACADLMAENGAISNSGVVQTTAAGVAAGLTITGNATILRDPAGKTGVTIRVAGLTPNATYAAHVHNLPCAQGGGGHYLINTDVVAVIESNEIWPTITTDAAGIGFGWAGVDHLARADATSIVIHDPVDPTIRVACVDFNLPGGFNTTATGVARLPNLAGFSRMVRFADGTTGVRMELTGLTPNTAYEAHVHDRPCGLGGGGHYKIDYGVAATVEANEIFVRGTSNANGDLSAEALSPHLARAEAQSIVIHDPADGGRLACADFN